MEGEAEAAEAGPSVFLPGRVPPRYQPDPRATGRWRKVRSQALERDSSRCVRCGEPATDVDHRVELIDGGAPYDLTNLQSLCEACHDAKSSEARYERARRASPSWERMTECPRCSGGGRCATCTTPPHPCGVCLGVRVVPETRATELALPSQAELAEVSARAWEGAVVRPSVPEST